MVIKLYVYADLFHWPAMNINRTWIQLPCQIRFTILNQLGCGSENLFKKQNLSRQEHTGISHL